MPPMLSLTFQRNTELMGQLSGLATGTPRFHITGSQYATMYDWLEGTGEGTLDGVLQEFEDDKAGSSTFTPQQATQRREAADAIVAKISAKLAGAFSDFYWRHLHYRPFVPILIDPDDPFPWELVRPRPDPSERIKQAPLLGQRFAMGRAKTATHGEPVTVPGLLAIAPDMKPRNPADPDPDDWAGIFGDQMASVRQPFTSVKALDEVRATFAKVVDNLGTHGDRVVHYMGHSYVNPGDLSQSWLPLAGSDKLRVVDLEDEEITGVWPWVFINACDAGRPAVPLGSSSWRREGWGGRLTQAGASAVIAPYWQVNSGYAFRAAQLFYQNLDLGMSLGEALRDMRWRFTNSDAQADVHTTLLAYALYGDPTLRVEFA